MGSTLCVIRLCIVSAGTTLGGCCASSWLAGICDSSSPHAWRQYHQPTVPKRSTPARTIQEIRRRVAREILRRRTGSACANDAVGDGALAAEWATDFLLVQCSMR